jgi:hypothetical protein
MNCVIAKIEPNSANDAKPMPSDATLKRGLRNRSRFSIGVATRSSQRMNARPSTAATAKQPRISGLVQPSFCASMIP